MSIERRSCTGSAPHVTKRLCATLLFFIGIVCIFGGYLLGRMTRNEVKRSNDIISINLTIAAENLYKQAKRILPKAMYNKDPDKVAAKLLDVFRCSPQECGGITNDNVAEFIKITINNEITKFIKSIHDASQYLDSLR